MRRTAKALLIGMGLVMSAMVLTGCGRQERLDRRAASEIVVFQTDNQMTQKPAMTPAQYESSSKAEPNVTTNITATPTATPKTSAKKTTSDADIEQLMDELEDTLNELDASITVVDQDTLTDSALMALSK